MTYGHADWLVSLPRCACGQPSPTVANDDQTPSCARCATAELRAAAEQDGRASRS